MTPSLVFAASLDGSSVAVNCYLRLFANLEGDLDGCLWLAGRGGGKFHGAQELASDGRLGEGGRFGGKFGVCCWEGGGVGQVWTFITRRLQMLQFLRNTKQLRSPLLICRSLVCDRLVLGWCPATRQWSCCLHHRGSNSYERQISQASWPLEGFTDRGLGGDGGHS